MRLNSQLAARRDLHNQNQIFTMEARRRGGYTEKTLERKGKTQPQNQSQSKISPQRTRRRARGKTRTTSSAADPYYDCAFMTILKRRSLLLTATLAVVVAFLRPAAAYSSNSSDVGTSQISLNPTEVVQVCRRPLRDFYSHICGVRPAGEVITPDHRRQRCPLFDVPALRFPHPGAGPTRHAHVILCDRVSGDGHAPWGLSKPTSVL